MCRFGQSDKSSAGCFSLRVLFLTSFFLFDSASFGQKPPKLEKNYREWLERDVVYLINKEERDAFRRLATNEARDKFIEDFWEIRNPPAPPQTLRDDLKFVSADARFSIGSGMEGWRTDRGRTTSLSTLTKKYSGIPEISIRSRSGFTAARILPPPFFAMFYQRKAAEIIVS